MERNPVKHLSRSEAEGEEGAADDDTEGDDDSQVVRLIVGSRLLRRKRAKRMLLTHLASRAQRRSGLKHRQIQARESSGRGRRPPARARRSNGGAYVGQRVEPTSN
jgi:hypothetical protein